MEHIINNVPQQLERGKFTRRQMIQCVAIAGVATAAYGMRQAAASSATAAESKGFQAVSIDHVSYLVGDYHKTADFYADLLGMKPYNDTGKAINLLMSNQDSYMVIRNATSNTPRCDHICYKIAKWDTAAVKAELERRGLAPRPVSDNPQSFIMKDVNGFGLQISGESFLPTENHPMPEKTAAESKGFQAVSIDHVSYLVDDYHKTADFYADLLGMKPYNDTGKAINLLMSNQDSYMVIRNATSNTPRCDHICYKIAKWDTAAVKAELERRGLAPRPVSDNPQSFIMKDVNGFGLQISGESFLPSQSAAPKSNSQ